MARIAENILAGAGAFQETIERIPGVKRFGGFLREQVKKSFEAQEEILDTQRQLSANLMSAFSGRELTPEEVKKLPVVDVFGAIGASVAISSRFCRATFAT